MSDKAALDINVLALHLFLMGRKPRSLTKKDSEIYQRQLEAELARRKAARKAARQAAK